MSVQRHGARWGLRDRCKRLLGWGVWLAVAVVCGSPASAAGERPIRSVVAPMRVISVQDGDTITVQREDGQRQRVRLAAIDAPERHQPYGVAARQALADRLANRAVLVGVRGHDRYRRWVGSVHVDGVDLNRWLVRQGWAWADRYAPDAGLIEAERQARQARRGLWRDAVPTPPWTYRRQVRAGNPQRTSVAGKP